MHNLTHPQSLDASVSSPNTPDIDNSSISAAPMADHANYTFLDPEKKVAAEHIAVTLSQWHANILASRVHTAH